MKKIGYAALYLVFWMVAGCSKDQPVIVLCDQVNLSFSTEITDAECGVPAGAIRVTAYGGAEPYRFKLNDNPTQTSGDFNGLRPGKYEVTVEDKNGCSTTTNVLIRSGISFKVSVKPIIETKCAISGCHDGSGNIDYRIFENFNPADMKARTQSGNMPKEGSLTQDEIDRIACWVDEGALNN